MGLNRSKGNMYDFVTHTWNTVKGECPHKCSYCYMDGIRKRFKKDCTPPYFDESELKTNLGKDNFIFVGSSNDLFAKEHPDKWIRDTLDDCNKFENRYLFQSKNPARILEFIDHPVFSKSVVCTTIESSIFYCGVMDNCPHPVSRSESMRLISKYVPTYVTIEPIMDFELSHMTSTIRMCNPKQVNIGANTGRVKLPEPSSDKIRSLIDVLEEFTIVKEKTNLKRILK